MFERKGWWEGFGMLRRILQPRVETRSMVMTRRQYVSSLTIEGTTSLLREFPIVVFPDLQTSLNTSPRVTNGKMSPSIFLPTDDLIGLLRRHPLDQVGQQAFDPIKDLAKRLRLKI